MVSAIAPTGIKCRLCRCLLDPDRAEDDLRLAVCGECRTRPEARRLGALPASAAAGAREFTAADKSLIRSVQGYMPPRQLLGILNERLVADLGPDAEPYTMEQLHAELQTAPGSAGAGDWASLRKLLAQARRQGVLEAVTPQLIDDFAVVFSLSPAQVLRLKDVVLSAKENAR